MNAYPPPDQQPGPYGPAGQYGTPGPYGAPGNPAEQFAAPAHTPYGYPEPPRKSKTPLIAGIVAVVVVVLVAAAVGAFLLFGDDDKKSSEDRSKDAGADKDPALSSQLIQPQGAPYSFKSPKGFEDAADRAPKVGEFQSVLAPEGGTSSSVISVSVVDLGTTDLKQIEQGVSQRLQSSSQKPLASSSVEVDGKQGLRLKSETANYDGVYHYVPTTQGRLVYFYCELAGADAAKVEAGCGQALDSMKVD